MSIMLSRFPTKGSFLVLIKLCAVPLPSLYLGSVPLSIHLPPPSVRLPVACQVFVVNYRLEGSRGQKGKSRLGRSLAGSNSKRQVNWSAKTFKRTLLGRVDTKAEHQRLNKQPAVSQLLCSELLSH